MVISSFSLFNYRLNFAGTRMNEKHLHEGVMDRSPAEAKLALMIDAISKGSRITTLFLCSAIQLRSDILLVMVILL